MALGKQPEADLEGGSDEPIFSEINITPLTDVFLVMLIIFMAWAALAIREEQQRAKEMDEHPTLTVELGGFTDPRGSVDYNYALSQRRVDAVRKFLIDKGIQLARIQSASLGPLTNSDIPDAKKRRVTLKLLVDRE